MRPRSCALRPAHAMPQHQLTPWLMRSQVGAVGAYCDGVSRWVEGQHPKPPISSAWPLLVVGQQLMHNVARSAAAREEVAFAIGVTAQHEKDVTVSPDERVKKRRA
eukprot:CAMPEP_0119320162 /NCGR_PEP_ID=MMETSP1333-20130426/51693_1 /TAXON_ID=418940 /ORGANISM="Scyphosphaera apsteinii, Strain RCC1455" /LENGTH=105 /DNA_ID=CAMNT_0007326819 /DNA_START=390 /DNA_END=707 /DNA_ORIENTATION=+